MESEIAIDLGRDAMSTTLMLALPILVIGLVVGMIMGVLQAITQVQDYTISVVPKIVIMLVVISLCLPWLMGVLATYSRELFDEIPRAIAGG